MYNLFIIGNIFTFMEINFTMDYRELSEPDIIAILGGRFREYRLNCRLTQKELAQQAGVSPKTLSAFEAGRGSNITMQNFLSLIRSVGLLERIDEVLPELPVSPYENERGERRNGRIRHQQNGGEE